MARVTRRKAARRCRRSVRLSRRSSIASRPLGARSEKTLLSSSRYPAGLRQALPARADWQIATMSLISLWPTDQIFPEIPRCRSRSPSRWTIFRRLDSRRHDLCAVARSAAARPRAVPLHARPAVAARRQGVRAHRGDAGARREGQSFHAWRTPCAPTCRRWT